MHELSTYHALFKKNPEIAKKFENMGLMRNGKFVIEVHDQNYTSKDKMSGSVTMFAAADEKSAGLPVKIRVGIDYLKGSQILGTDGKWHAATLEGVLVNELAHLSSQSSNEEQSNIYENCLLAGFGQPKRDIKSERAIFNHNQNGKIQTLYDSPTGKKFAGLIDPQHFPDFKLDEKAQVAVQNTGQKPQQVVVAKS